jgi:hypothetical protein
MLLHMLEWIGVEFSSSYDNIQTRLKKRVSKLQGRVLLLGLSVVLSSSQSPFREVKIGVR